jgi:hypothetical protein
VFVQWLIIGVLAVLATAYFARSFWRTFIAAKSGCGGGCGCAAAPKQVASAETIIPVEQLTSRLKSARRED